MNRHFPFDAAIFDLDGTLLDSMYVWGQIDREFFARHNRELTEEYVRGITGMGFMDTARFTKAYLNLADSPEKICAQWTRMACEEYALRVPLKAGALEYLKLLKRCNIRLAIATSNTRELFEPCLRRLGVYDLFDTFCTTDETGEKDKSQGTIFRLAADRLGVAYENCCVFEDLIEGIRGAKNAGMAAYCIMDNATRHAHEQICGIADRMVRSFVELTDEISCTIFTAHCEGDAKSAYHPIEREYVLCADAGWRIAESVGAQIDVTIGDFDSGDPPAEGRVIRYPVMKDDPDAMLCIRCALEMGIRDFHIIGGIGGRLDHTLANIQALRFIAGQGGRAELHDGRANLYVVRNGEIAVPRREGKLSVFALTASCEGVTIRGAKYGMENGRIRDDFPIGMGNDFVAEAAHISVRDGTLLIISENFQTD